MMRRNSSFQASPEPETKVTSQCPKCTASEPGNGPPLSQTKYKAVTPAEHERLTILMEECAEVIQAAAKIQRFGYHSSYDNGIGNRDQLETEIGQLENIISMMIVKGDVNPTPIAHAKAEKAAVISKYLVHQ